MLPGRKVRLIAWVVRLVARRNEVSTYKYMHRGEILAGRNKETVSVKENKERTQSVEVRKM